MCNGTFTGIRICKKNHNKFTGINNNKIIPQTWNIINEDCVELRYTEDVGMIIESDYISEITAVFTTANARIRLYIK